MDKTLLAEGLKDSCLTPAEYYPTTSIKSYKQTVIAVNGSPVVGVGASDDEATQIEANNLLNSSSFKDLVYVAFNEGAEISILQVGGSDIEWNDEEIGICKKEAGEVEFGDEEANLHWLVFGKDALSFATAMCLSKDIQKIAV